MPKPTDEPAEAPAPGGVGSVDPASVGYVPRLSTVFRDSPRTLYCADEFAQREYVNQEPENETDTPTR
ncbi:MAG: hypothetical protein QF486_06550 [Candidatus Woesearchaeota archaeon]|jgi:hypothetical protein|nr:hypothetical protein [Candidatus Woesearchaeota archaeon]MDP7181932.1 hypothetical protein [Candidatus Woesearchaeota archaeon]MDP7199247.1 hypothetical protein [Candidatus Woesearchaeota archaeon]MDP7467860.1 hypothetical protein [Candidatus Woesearchaeota archaeon]MDP7647850.1 hypothetical protein [Candidatus Woesearchaeota archaeon]